jgi:hypothetical protein
MAVIDAAIRLSFGEAIRILMAVLEIEPTDAARSAFGSRVRQLQRMGLLGRSGDKSYERFTYGLVELARLATTFRLMTAFMLPSVAKRFVTERWADILPGVVAGIGDAAPHDFWSERDGAAPDRPVVVIEGVSLAELGQKTTSDPRYDGPLGMIALLPAIGMPSADSERPIVAGAMIDTRPYMTKLVEALLALEAVSEARVADEIDRLRFSALD